MLARLTFWYISYMGSHTTTISTKGQIVIPANIREDMDLKPGTRVVVIREGTRIILQPVNKQLIEELRGITAGGPSGTEMLLKERREESKRGQW